MLLCLAPVILIGYAAMFGGETSRYPLEKPTPQLEVRSCQRGFGTYVNATPTGLYAGGLQYGFQHTIGVITVSFIPHFGASYTDHMVLALPSYTQFDVGGGLYASHKHLVVGFKVSHWSNGAAIFNWNDSAGRENIGINMVVFQIGYLF